MNLKALVMTYLIVLCGHGPAACSQSEAGDPEVTLPYVCHPQAQVDVLLQPRTENPQECSGVGTWDIPAGPDGCPQAWIHGEQMCPQEAWCDTVVKCVAYSDWSVGTCQCGEAPYTTCCPVTIVAPKDGDPFTDVDDIDPTAEGIQIEVTVDIDCWDMYGFPLFIHACEGPPGEQVQWSEPHPDHVVTGTPTWGRLQGVARSAPRSVWEKSSLPRTGSRSVSPEVENIDAFLR